MTPLESRELFIESQFSCSGIETLKQQGLYLDYVEGRISIYTIYTQLKDQGL